MSLTKVFWTTNPNLVYQANLLRLELTEYIRRAIFLNHSYNSNVIISRINAHLLEVKRASPESTYQFSASGEVRVIGTPSQVPAD
jgi:hypothetical protein